MMRMIDPLNFLRENIQQNNKIYRENNDLVFSDGIRLDINLPTAIFHFQTKKPYTLGTLWCYLISRQIPLSNYLKETQKEGVDIVSPLDKDKINDFFINNIDNIDIIDDDLRQETVVFLKRKRKGDPFIRVSSTEGNSKNSTQGITESDLKNGLKGMGEGKGSKRHSHKKKYEDLDPNLAIMNYIYQYEKKSLNRNSMLKPVNNISSFEGLLHFCKGIFTKTGNVQKQNETLSFLDELMSADDLRSKAIIVVPQNFIEGNLTLENAKEFLFDAHYIDLKTCTEEERERCEMQLKKNTFNKTINGKELLFEICSNVRNFKKNEWKRVVGVFVQGEEWEFKDWPKNENVTSILQKVKGFHLKYQDLPSNENVKKWNVKILEISRTKRHFDVSVQNEFWMMMSEFLSQPRRR